MMIGAAELRLLLATARASTTAANEAAIRAILVDGVDWTIFTRCALDHGLASLAGHTLTRVAPDLVPDELLNAFRAMVEQTREINLARFKELMSIMAALSQRGIEAIPFKGPILALRTYGDLGLRVFRDLDFLIRDDELKETVAALRAFGYERREGLKAAQFDWIHWLQGQEILFKREGEGAVEPHTRLTSVKMALDIDYAGLWQRAQQTDMEGQKLLTLAPEDELLVLAIHGGKELWWSVKWVCDFVAFLGSHPRLDWEIALERAKAQGCFRMVLLAAALARRYFDSTIPDTVAAAERSDPVIAAMASNILAQWQTERPIGPPSNNTLSMEKLRLHDGLLRRARYVAKTMFLPGPDHIAVLPLPRCLGFAYIPLKFGLARARRSALPF